MTNREQARALIERLHEIWGTGELDAIPEIYAADFVAHMPKGWDKDDGIRRAIERIRAGFPDWQEHIDDMVIEGDRVAVRYHSTGSHLGTFGTRAPTSHAICLNDDLAFDKQIDGKSLE